MLGGLRTEVDILTRSHTNLLAAVERWCEARPELRGTVELVFAGVTSERDEEIAQASRVGALVRFPGYLAHAESVALVRTADLLFLPMHNLPRGERSRIVPGKTYEYMAAERPILAAVPDGDARDFLDRCGTAALCRPDDVESMVELLDGAYEGWSRKSPIRPSNRDFVHSFDRHVLAHSLATSLNALLANSSQLSSMSHHDRARMLGETGRTT